MHRCGIDPRYITHACANPLQDYIYQESIDLLNENSDVQYAFFDIHSMSKITELIFYSANSAITCGKEKKYESSFNFLDFADKALSVAKGIGNGIVYLWIRTMEGFETGGNDIKCINNS